MPAPASGARALSSLFPQKSNLLVSSLGRHRPRSFSSSSALPHARALSQTNSSVWHPPTIAQSQNSNNSLSQAFIRARAQSHTYTPFSHSPTRTQSHSNSSPLWHSPARAQSSSPATAASGVASMARTVKVDVTSDTVCPWCFVGKKNLEAAIEQLPEGIEVEVTWRPFQLNPGAPQEGVSKEQLYREKFGPRVPAMMERMSAIFAGFGHKISLGGLTGNTLDSHRLLWWARHGPQGNAGKQNALAEELFLDYFTREKYIGDRDVLAAAAERVGLTGAREFLDDPVAGVKEVQQELREYGRGVTGVPYFRVAGQELSGAQPPEVLAEALKQAAS